MKQVAWHHIQPPVVVGVYRDKSGSSLVVVNIIDGEVLVEYADGTVTRMEASNWRQLHPRSAVY